MWFTMKNHPRAVASLSHKCPYRVTFYWKCKDDYLERRYDQVSKIYYIDKQEAIDALEKLEYEED